MAPGMNMSQNQSLRMEQSMQLSQSMILSLNILQQNIQNLEQQIVSELEDNPMLEVVEPEVDAEELPDPDRDSNSEEVIESDHRDVFDDFYSPFIEDSSTQGSYSDDDDEMDPIESASSGEDKNLHDHLEEQIVFLDPPEEVVPYVFLLISHLDERGYLPLSLEEIALGEEFSIDGKLLKRGLEILQSLDPAGIGARDLRECFLLQTKRFGGRKVYEVEVRILEDCFEDLLHNRIQQIAKTLKVDIERVNDALDFFKTLSMRPAAPFTGGDTLLLPPDAEITYDPPSEENGRGIFHIQLSRKGIPELEVVSGSTFKKTTMSKEEKKFILEKTNSAKALKEAIRRRDETLLVVINAICQHQEPFFNEGPDQLKPLQMQDVAKEINMAPATVTRAVKEKVVKTDWGLFPLRHFFSKAVVVNQSGQEVERDDVLKAIQEIVDTENKKKPLSDKAIANQLKEKGFDAAQRTVNKYRGMLNIPSSSQRKEY